MKWVLTLNLVLLLIAYKSIGQETFITTWQPGADSTISIPTGSVSYNYSIDWGDGTSDTAVTGSISHKYDRIDTFTVEISGTFPQIIFHESNEEEKLLSIEQWGDQEWSTMLRAFSGCSNLVVNALDTPDLSAVLHLSEMFQNCSNFNQPINHWDVSNVRYMHHLFSGATAFNHPLDSWDVSNVRSMFRMFENATSFNQDLSTWNTGSATVLSYMFVGATSFDQNLGSWDISSISFLEGIFSGIRLSTEHYDSTLIGWARLDPGETSIPTHKYFADTESQFCAGADARDSLINVYNWVFEDGGLMCPVNYDSAFITTWVPESDLMISIPTGGGNYNYSIDWGDGHEDLNVSGTIDHSYDSISLYTIKIIGEFPRILFYNSGEATKIKTIEQWGNIEWSSMANAFRGCRDLKVNAWDAPDLSGVTTCFGMFASTDSLNQPIGHWNTSNVKDMSWMFFGSNKFNQNIGSWQVDKVTNMSFMFYSAYDFNQPLNTWNVSSVINMQNMFSAAFRFNQDLSDWQVDNVENMNFMFSSAHDFNQDIGGWNVSKVTKMWKMFDSAYDFDQNLALWDIANVTDLRDFLDEAGLSTSHYDSTITAWSKLTLQEGLAFDGGSSTFCLSQAPRDSIMEKFNWSIQDGGKNCDSYFGDALVMTFYTGEDSTITLPTLGNGYDFMVDWGDQDTIAYHIQGDILHRYSDADTFTIRLKGDFPRIYFNGEVGASDLLSIDNWGNNIWYSMESSFNGCTNLSISATDAPDLNQVQSMKSMFRKCTSLNAPINHWDVSQVEDMSFLFDSATVFNQPLDQWQTTKLRHVSGIFRNARSFDQDISQWIIDSVRSLNIMFQGAINFNQDLQNWNTSTVENMSQMFANATSFSQDLGHWNISKVSDLSDMFVGTGLTTEDFDRTLLGWKGLDSLQDDVAFNAGTSTYCYGQNVISYLQDSIGWNLQSGGLDTECDTGDCPAIANFYNGSWDEVPTIDRALYIWDDYDTSIDGIFEGCTLEVFGGVQMQVHLGDTIDVGNNP